MPERFTVNVASVPEFFGALRTLAIAGYVWDESGLTLLNPPFQLAADFIKPDDTTNGDNQ